MKHPQELERWVFAQHVWIGAGGCVCERRPSPYNGNLCSGVRILLLRSFHPLRKIS